MAVRSTSLSCEAVRNASAELQEGERERERERERD